VFATSKSLDRYRLSFVTSACRYLFGTKPRVAHKTCGAQNRRERFGGVAGGRLFHARGPATANARSYSVGIRKKWLHVLNVCHSFFNISAINE